MIKRGKEGADMEHKKRKIKGNDIRNNERRAKLKRIRTDGDLEQKKKERVREKRRIALRRATVEC